MRKDVFFKMLFGVVLLASSTAANIVTLKTSSDIEKYSRNKPLICFLSLDCDIGSYASDRFTQALSDLDGPNIGVYDVNSFPRTIYDSQQVDILDTVIIVKNRVVASSGDGDRNQNLFSGNRELRDWVNWKLQELKVDFTMGKTGPSRAKPLADSISTVNLSKDNIAWFNFESTKDRSGKNSVIDGTASELAGIKSGVYFCDGNYNATGRTAIKIKNSSVENATSTSFSFGLNVNLSESLESKYGGTFYQGGPSGISLFRSPEGKLVIIADADRADPDNTSKTLSWADVYTIPEIDFTLDVWHNIQIVVDYAQKRIKLYFDGKRYDDLILSDELISLLRQPDMYARNVLGEFGNASSGSLLFGYGDDLVIYARAINSAEALALYKRDAKGVTNVNDNDFLPPIPPSSIEDVANRDTGTWAGGWETFWGSGGSTTTSMDISVAGPKISGTYNYKSGKIEGSARSNGTETVFTGTWTQSNSKGWFVFTLMPDGTSFKGTWGYDGKAAEAEGWNGYRRAVNFGRSGVRQ